MGKGGDTTTVQKQNPWKPAQPYLQDILGQGSNLYQSGAFSPDPYGGQRVADQSGATTGAYNYAMDRGTGSPWITQAHNGLSGVMGGQGYGGLTQNDPRLTAMGQADPRLAQMTSGKSIYNNLAGVRQQALGDAVPAAMSMFSGNGMTDSSAAMDSVGRAATQAVAPIDYQAWQGAQDRQLQAVGQDNATRLQAIGLNDNTRLNALGQRGNQQIAAAGLAPELQRAQYLPAMMMQQFGAGRDAYNQSKIDANIQKWYEQQGQQAGNLQGYADLINRISGQGGVSTTSAPGTSPIGNALGAGLGGLGAYGALAMNPATAPFALLGGVGAGLAGLF